MSCCFFLLHKSIPYRWSYNIHLNDNLKMLCTSLIFGLFVPFLFFLCSLFLRASKFKYNATMILRILSKLRNLQIDKFSLTVPFQGLLLRLMVKNHKRRIRDLYLQIEAFSDVLFRENQKLISHLYIHFCDCIKFIGCVFTPYSL